MSPEEKNVIAGIFDRVKIVANEPRDPEAERFIAEQVQRQPYAPYVLSQAIHVQEQALQNLHQQNEELKRQVEELSQRPAGSGGFLSGLFGGGAAPQPAPQPTARSAMPGQRPMGAPGMGAPGMMGAQPGTGAAAGPWGQQQRGGFLAGAMTTAMGVAGGMLLGSALMSAFGGDSAKAAEGGDDSSASNDDEAGADADVEDAGLDGGDW